jgi:hypothetical protein
LSGTTATVRPPANQESTGLRPASSESGPTGLRAFIIILPSTGKQERESRQRESRQAWRRRSSGRARGGGTPDADGSADADKQDDSDSDPGNGPRTQTVLRC